MAPGEQKPLESVGLEAIEQQARKVLPPPAGHPRFPLLDAIRAIAAIAILLVHVGIFTGSFDSWWKQPFAQLDVGVPVFFLLSGFLLYRPMLAARVIGLPQQKLTAYGRNRFVRIAPAFWVVLTISALVPGFYGAFTENWWVYYGLLQSLPVYTAEGNCAVTALECGFPPAWSLGVEVLFYLTLPLYALVIARISRAVGSRKWLPVEISGLVLLAVASLFVQSSVPVTDLERWLFFSPIGRGWWFALGMGLAVVSVWTQLHDRKPVLVRWIADHPNLCWAVAAVIYLFLAIVLLEPDPSLAFPIIDPEMYLISVICFGIVALLLLLPAIFGHERSGFVRQALRNRVLVWLGLISYGIFLWHYPVMWVMLDLGVRDLVPSAQFPVMVLFTFAGTVVMAALSFYLIERPLMLWSRRRGTSKPRPG